MENKTKKSPKTNVKNENAEINEVDNVDKIRDILFGSQMREVEQRFSNLEKRLAKDLASMRNENTLQIESLKSFVESEFDILASKLAAETKSRIENIDDLDGSVNQHVKQIETRFGDVVQSLDDNSREINQKILKQTQDFGSELNSQIGEARERMDSHRQELSDAKVDKLLLSEMLNAIAVQITADDSGK